MLHVALALVIGIASAIAWSIVLVRYLAWYRARRLRRSLELVMPIVGILAAVGSLASALGYASQLGYVGPLPLELLTLAASMGRGALFAGALVVLATIHPPEVRR